MIFETERLLVRQLKSSDIEGFYVLESNPEVLKYALGEVDSYDNIKKNLLELIEKYKKPNNDYWIYAIERKADHQFLGTIALIKDDKGDDEIGYRFIEEFWGLGYGFEVCSGLVTYAKQNKLEKLIAYVIDENYASVKILKKLSFKAIKKSNKCESIPLPETKYELVL